MGFHARVIVPPELETMPALVHAGEQFKALLQSVAEAEDAAWRAAVFLEIVPELLRRL